MNQITEGSPLVAPVSSGSRKVNIYLGLLALFTFPHAASQIAIYDLLYDVVCSKHGLSPQECLNDPRASKSVADLLSSASFITGVVATVVMAVIASLSDHLGRKRGLIWNLTFATLAIASFPLLAYGVSHHATYWRMIIPYILTALSGSTSLILNLSLLYISDCLPEPQSRTNYLSIMLGILMLLQGIAPGIGSLWLKTGISLGTYMSVCAVMMAISILAFAFLVEDKRSGEISDLRAHLREFVGKAIGTVSFKNCEQRAQRRNAWILLVNFFFSNEFAIGFLDLLIVYAKHKFGWEVSQIGEVMFYLFSIKCAWALVGFPILYSQLSKKWAPMIDKVDWPDMVHMVTSSLLTLVGYILIGFAKSSSQYKRGVMTLANDGLAGPIWVNALLKYVGESQRGEFLAALGLFIKPLGAFLPAMLMKIFQATIDTNVVFLVLISMAALTTTSLLFLKVQT